MLTFLRGTPLLSLLFSLLILGTESPASSQVLWRGDFETANLNQWSGTLNLKKRDRNNISVVQLPVKQGSYAAKLSIHPDDLFPNGHNRVELHYDGKQTSEGQTTFFSFWFQLPEQAHVHEDIAYWETSGPKYQQAMAFYVDPQGEGTQIAFRTNHPTALERWKASVTVGQWHQIAMRITWSVDSAKGRVSVWFDGTQIVENISAQTKPNDANLFVQVGLHRDITQPFTESIYIDDAVEGTVLGDVLSRERRQW